MTGWVVRYSPLYQSDTGNRNGDYQNSRWRFPRRQCVISFSSIAFPWKPGDGFSIGESVQFAQIETLEVASEESVKKLGGTIGWGIVGATLLGPVGLLAGLLAGGRKNEVTFVCKFKDGRKMLATTDSKTFTKMQAAIF